ncbi:MarR family transcriptional regulator [Candidatus Nitrosocosmicus franklandus]|uniref:Uncharacterized protein n=1 Tax=Candidatus Nitrosocosmicus franklandianus TaxID=1798806 RepID=A0A484IFA0_9ARCH|nr:helix-turn-helix domain-containing protein [Candidatus Nitrosocosmicus franklandus]VFJ14691.1 conserved protein of unknown function [Candidatus Nitrosocosmicus franklandus]
MGNKIPHAIRIQVLNGLLSGTSHSDIAFSLGISKGTVSNILNECRKQGVVDIDLLRSFARKMKDQGLELNDLAFSLHLRNMLKILELSEEKLDEFLLALSIYNYKNNIQNPEKFIKEVKKVSDYVARLDVSIFDLVDYIEERKVELKKLEIEIYSAKMDLGMLKYRQKQIESHIKRASNNKTIENNTSIL